MKRALVKITSLSIEAALKAERRISAVLLVRDYCAQFGMGLMAAREKVVAEYACVVPHISVRSLCRWEYAYTDYGRDALAAENLVGCSKARRKGACK